MDANEIFRLDVLADALTTVLIHFVWQGSVLALTLYLVVKLLGVRSIQVRYLLSVATLIAMGLAPVITLLRYQQDTALDSSTLLSGHQSLALRNEIVGREYSDWRFVAHFTQRSEFQAVVVITWLIGVLFLSTRLLMGFGVTLWIRLHLKPVPEKLERLARDIGRRMKIAAENRVFVSLKVGQAVAVGFLQPIVLIPVAWLTELTPDMLEAVIAHELAHIRRWDLWVNLLQRVIETLLFFHPAVWWLSQRIRLEREICCDEMAVNCLDRAAYARSLESVARMARGNLLLAASIQGGMKMNLLSRIRYLLGNAPAETANWGAAGLVAMIVPVLGMIAFSLTTTSAPKTAQAEPTASTEVADTNFNVGDGVGVKLMGDAAKEFYRLNLPNQKYKPGYHVDVIGRVTEIHVDGSYKIENTLPVEAKGEKRQQFSMTLIGHRSQVKLFPKPANDDGGTLTLSGGTLMRVKTVAKGSETKTEKAADNKAAAQTAKDEVVTVTFSDGSITNGKIVKTVENGIDTITLTLVPAKPDTSAVQFNKIERRYIEISDLKDVTFKLCEPKEQVGK